MIVVLAAVARTTGVRRRQRPVARAVDADLLCRAGRTTLPGALRTAPPTIWWSPSATIVLACWSNEGRDLAPHADVNAMAVTIGTRADAGVRGGCTLTVTADDRRVRASRSFNGIEALFVGQTGSVFVVGNRASTISAVLSGCGRPRYRVERLAPLLRCGFYTTHGTPFDGVDAVALNHDVWADGSQLRCVEVASAVRDASGTEGRQAAAVALSAEQGAAELSDALISAVSPLATAAGEVRISLTGGRDSRLIAAALAAKSIPFRARTYGFAEHPDVVCAREVATQLGVGHDVTLPMARDVTDGLGAEQVAAFALRRAARALRNGDGAISVYENLGAEPRNYDPRPVLGGQGGETLRGGYAHYCSSLDGEAAAVYLTRSFGRYPSVIASAARAAYDRHLEQWARRARSNPLDTLDRFYLEYRAGRWSSSARAAYRASRNLVQPFLDGAVMTAGARVAAQARADERLIALTLQRLRPDLVGVPFANSPWRYEQGSGTAPPGLPTSTVVTTSSGAGRYDWRRDYGPVWTTFFRDYVLSTGDERGLFDVVDRATAERVLTDTPRRLPALVWSLFTAAVLLSDAWLDADPHTVQEPSPSG